MRRRCHGNDGICRFKRAYAKRCRVNLPHYGRLRGGRQCFECGFLGCPQTKQRVVCRVRRQCAAFLRQCNAVGNVLRQNAFCRFAIHPDRSAAYRGGNGNGAMRNGNIRARRLRSPVARNADLRRRNACRFRKKIRCALQCNPRQSALKFYLVWGRGNLRFAFRVCRQVGICKVVRACVIYYCKVVFVVHACLCRGVLTAISCCLQNFTTNTAKIQQISCFALNVVRLCGTMYTKFAARLR